MISYYWNSKSKCIKRDNEKWYPIKVDISINILDIKIYILGGEIYKMNTNKIEFLQKSSI